MASAFVDALKMEIAQLDRVLRSDIRYARLREAERLLALYEGGSKDAPLHGFIPAPQVSLHVGRQFLGPEATSRRTSPERAMAMESAEMYVRNRKGPVPTADIYAHLQSLGIPVGGEKPVNNLSAMLSNSNLFQSNGRAGWTLRKPSILGRTMDDTYDYDGPWDDADGASQEDADSPSRGEQQADETKDERAFAQSDE